MTQEKQKRKSAIIFGLLIATMCYCTTDTNEAKGKIEPPEGQIETASGTWNLVWSDEFDGSGFPDPLNWTHEVAIWPTGGNQLYTDDLENCYQDGGNLHVVALERDGLGENDRGEKINSTSCRIISYNKYEFTYGRIEFKAKLPKIQGAWPALWLLGRKIMETDEYLWPHWGEIDVLETVGDKPNVHASLHALELLLGKWY